ncbi:MAG: HAD-IIB family hydrolase [Planctomycetaceae bacterium]
MSDPLLLISDVDGTLLEDDAALRELAEWTAARRASLRLVYSSGRFFDSVFASVRDRGMPEPHAIIGGVGTDVRQFDNCETLGDWPVLSGRWNPHTLRAILAEFDELEPQPHEVQSDYKLSYFGYDLSAGTRERIQSRLERAFYAIELVYSSRRDLDVLPFGINKGAAAVWLAEFWDFPPQRVIVAGDSGNDLAMFQRGFRGIVVANAHEELRALRLPNVYHAQRPYAAGVLEGLKHWTAGPRAAPRGL